jgi:hypothetical protein
MSTSSRRIPPTCERSNPPRLASHLISVAALSVMPLASCASTDPDDTELSAEAAPLTVSQRITSTSMLPAGCGAALSGTNYPSTEVQPMVAADPANPAHLIATYQQDRWSALGSNGVVAAVSSDLGATWKPATPPPLTRCTGGTDANGGNYEVGTDSWVTISRTGTAFLAEMAINRTVFTTAMLVSRSTDGGHSWSAPTTLIRDDDPEFFDDRPTITADPVHPGTVYMVWDRIDDTSTATADHFFQSVYFSRSTNDGVSWEPAREVYNPGLNQSTLGHEIVVLPDGTLIDGFGLNTNDGAADAWVFATIRSTDQGRTWSTGQQVDHIQAAGSGNGGLSIADPDGIAGAIRNPFLPQIAVDPRSGALYAVWTDTRFGTPASIGFTTSRDGGRTWSPLVKINKTPGAGAAVLPAITVSAQGTVGVTYFDFRNNTPDPATLPTDAWLVTCSRRCTDPASWTENHVAGPSDSRMLPNTGLGLMLGDYTGLVAPLANIFIAVSPIANDGNTANRSDLQRAVVVP